MDSPSPSLRAESFRRSSSSSSEHRGGGRRSRMRQDKLTGSLRRGGRCLKRQGGGGGVGTILSNVLKKRSCISRTAPRLLCTLEPGEARAADGRWGAGVCGAPAAWEGWEQTPAWVRSAATRARRTRRPAEAAPRPMRLWVVGECGRLSPPAWAASPIVLQVPWKPDLQRGVWVG